MKLGTHRAVFETYRQPYQTGMRITKNAMFSMKAKVYQVADQHHGLLTICPPEIRRAIFRDIEDGDFRDYEPLNQEILDGVERELEEV